MSFEDRQERVWSAAVYAICVVLVLALIGDKYSFGEFETVEGMGGSSTRHAWQLIAAAASAVAIVGVLVSFRRHARAALLLTVLEVSSFLVVNCVLYLRDGQLRFVDWDYGHSATRFNLFAIGLVLRAVLLWRLFANARTPVERRVELA